jgi:hypothetical protein
MKTTLPLLLCLSALGLSGAAMAHGITKPQHGGVVQMTGETLFELVTAPAGVTIYVLDEDEPVNAAAMTGKLTISAAGKKSEVALAPAGGHKFFAKGLKLPKGANVGVMVVDNASKARYGATFLIK